jgi:hypothetical protein
VIPPSRATSAPTARDPAALEPVGRSGERNREDDRDQDRQQERDELAEEEAEQQQPGGEQDRAVGDVGAAIVGCQLSRLRCSRLR